MGERRKWFSFLLLVLLLLLAVCYLFHRRQERDLSSPDSPGVGGSSSSMPAARPAPAGPWHPPEIAYDREPGYRQFGEFDNSYSGTQGRYLILVRVYSAELQPISGAAVSLYRSADLMSETFSDLMAGSATGESGSCQIELNSPLAPATLVVSKAEFAAAWSSVELEEPGLVRRDFALTPASAYVRGRVTDAQGSPIAGAMVSNTAGRIAEDPTGPLRVKSFADSQGDYQLGPLPAGNPLIGAGAEGYTPASIRINNLEREGVRANVDFRLQPAGMTFVDVRVVDTAGRPILGATVSTRLGRALPAGSDGFVRLHIKAEDASDPFQCAVKADDYKTRFTAIDPQRAHSVLVLEKANVLSGIVTGPGGVPLPGASIRLSAPGTDQKGARTDAAGAFSLKVSASPGIATISKAGYADSRADYDAYAASQFLRITLAPAGGVFGRAVDDSGLPVWKFRVTVHDLEGKAPDRLPRIFSSFDGDFALTDLPPGKYALGFQSIVIGDGWPLRGRMEAIEVRPGSIYGPVTVVLTPLGR